MHSIVWHDNDCLINIPNMNFNTRELRLFCVGLKNVPSRSLILKASLFLMPMIQLPVGSDKLFNLLRFSEWSPTFHVFMLAKQKFNFINTMKSNFWLTHQRQNEQSLVVGQRATGHGHGPRRGAWPAAAGQEWIIIRLLENVPNFHPRQASFSAPHSLADSN